MSGSPAILKVVFGGMLMIFTHFFIGRTFTAFVPFRGIRKERVPAQREEDTAQLKHQLHRSLDQFAECAENFVNGHRPAPVYGFYPTRIPQTEQGGMTRVITGYAA